ncbi:MAG: Thioredoxin, partial [uncultured Ramlibacter sp.]
GERPHQAHLRRDLRGRRPEGRKAGPGRLLGRVVRALQDDRAHPRRGLQHLPGQAAGGQDERRREPRHPGQVRHPRHPDADAVQGRPAGRHQGRRDEQGAAHRFPRPAAGV